MRVLIATVTAGGGHLAAAAALEETWRVERPHDVVERVDILKFCSALEAKMHSKAYLKIAQKAPELWGMMFRTTDDPAVARKLSRLKRALPSASRTRIARYMAQFAPDAVLCTHYMPLETLGFMRGGREDAKGSSRGNSPAPRLIASVVTDYEAHVLWMDACVDLYCVAAEQTKARLVARGASPGNVVATGIPVSRKFSGPIDTAGLRRRLGLRDDLPVVLVLSGGFGMGPVEQILTQLDQVKQTFQTMVVTGRNEELRQAIAAQDRAHPTDVFGFASNMHELMAVSDLIISKPGGLTTAEALALGKPLLIVDPIPGQEAANSDFLLERGAGVKINRADDIPFRVGQLLGSKKLDELTKAAANLGKPDAATRICHEVARRCGVSQAGS